MPKRRGKLGRTIAARGLRLVYGGAKVGLMGVLADARCRGRQVIGVIPGALVEREIAHAGLTEMHQVKIDARAQGDDGGPLGRASWRCPAAPARWRSSSRIWTWAQLGHHRKPVGLLNVGGFFDALLAFLDQS